MRKTDNYELNLVEGGDVVNPLVQDVPNYIKIDTEMKRNSVCGIGFATELLTGNVHALTRENPDAPMFRFVATSNFKTGDTFTVDGLQVTCLATTGENLTTGCYVIGANVLCCLTGTLLTIFCLQGGEDTVYNSERLGGKEASEYATNADLNEVEQIAQGAVNIGSNNATDINILKQYHAKDCSWINIGTGVSLRCRSGVVTIRGASYGDVNISANNKYNPIATVPSEYMPSASSLPFPVSSAGGDMIICGDLTNDRNISLWASKGTSYWAFCLTYCL